MSATSKQRLARWVRGEIADADAISLPELTARAVEWAMADPDYLRALLGELLHPTLYAVVQDVCARTRAHLVMGDDVLSVPEAKRRLAARRPRWQAWLEHAGERHIRLPEMTRVDLLNAADERERRGARELRLAALWRRLAAGLSEGQTVGEVYTEEEIDALAQEWAARDAAPTLTIRTQEAAD